MHYYWLFWHSSETWNIGGQTVPYTGVPADHSEIVYSVQISTNVRKKAAISVFHTWILKYKTWKMAKIWFLNHQF